jgi:signal transduction histidine kinase
MVAHEFNNILTPVLNYAQLAMTGDEAMRDKAIQRAYEGAVRAGSICQALLDVAGNGSDKPRRVSLQELVENTLAAMGRDPAKDGIQLVKKVPADLKMTTRPAELKQVLLNLLLNAHQAVLAKSRSKSISITAGRSNGQVRIRVADTGAGIAREDLERIFEPFFTTKGDTGSGLGLAVCREIVESLRGRLDVRSEPGKGTCFTVVLPVNAKAPAPARQSRKPAAKSA